MVFRVEVTARAERDLEAIASYVAERACSAIPALQWFDEMAAAIRDLGRSPHRFAVEEDLTALRGREYRRRFVGNYRVVFRILEDTVVVDSVIHGSRDVTSVEDLRP